MIHISRNRWLVSAAFIAAGILAYVSQLLVPARGFATQPWTVWLATLVFLCVPALLGAGVGNLFRRPTLGALLALGVVVAIGAIRVAMLGPDGLKRRVVAELADLASDPRVFGKIERGFRVEDGQAAYHTFNNSRGHIVRKIPDADTTTFRALSHAPNARILYAVDSSHVYSAEGDSVFKIGPADAQSFAVLDPPGFFTRDQLNVYFRGAALPGADPASFEVLEYPFGKDRQRAFIGIAPIPVADIASWQPLQRGNPDDPWLRSPDRAQPRSIDEFLLMGWSRDNKHMYWGNKMIPAADPATFELLTPSQSRSTPGIMDFYSKDKDHVFYAEAILPDADPGTFQVDDRPAGPWDAHDAAHRYRSGKTLPQ